MIKRIHNTNEETLSKSTNYHQNERHNSKPYGFWYGINDEWLEWCEGERPHWIKKYLFELDINMSNIIVVSTPYELNKFCEEYEGPISKFGFTNINWERVANDYSRIEFTNYHFLKYKSSCDISKLWLYGWDISGGCIWDLNVIKGFKKITTPKKWFKNEPTSTY